MFAFVLSAVLVAVVLFQLEKNNKDSVVDLGGLFALMVASGICYMLVFFVALGLGVNPHWLWLAWLLYFIIPFAMVKGVFNYSTSRAAAYGGIAVTIVVLSEFSVYLAFKGL